MGHQAKTMRQQQWVEVEYEEGQPKPDDVEVDGAGFFSLKEMEAMDIADMTHGLTKIAFDGQSNGYH